MKNHKLHFLMSFILASLLFWSCTNLDETPLSQVTPDNFFKTEDEVLAAVIPVYNSARAWSWSEAAHQQEVTSDEIFVPTRGGDWDDGGDWRRMQEHTWTPSESRLNTSWTDLYAGVARANAALESMEASPLSGSDLVRTFKAEVRFLRALFYWWLMDMFGNVPVVSQTLQLGELPVQNTRQQVFDFVVSEINAALPDLQASFEAADYGRATKGAANALLATVYLNAEVYTGTPRWGECVAACDAVINSGMYNLLPNYRDVFALENEGPANVENIFVVGNLPASGVGWNRQQATLHYNQIPITPWNGFSVLADFYNRYDTSDVRFGVMLVGPQLVLAGPNAGQPATDRQGNPLVFTVDSPLFGASESHGVRILKWPLDPNQVEGDAGNDFAIFRYSHILLAKAEALFRMMGPKQESVDLINQVRARAFDPDKPIALADLTLDTFLNERGFELLWEEYRRTDLIRFRRFLDAWTLKPPSDGPRRNLFPIPQVQLDANPNLRQNTGY
jgi:hypothetical protein